MTSFRPAFRAGIVTFVTALCFPCAAFALDETPAARNCVRTGNPAVRSTDGYTRTLLDAGIARSPTFAALVEALEASDLVAIVEPAPRLPSALSGSLVFMAATTSCRYVRIRFAVAASEVRAIATLGHELQHAVEVARHPGVVDAGTLRTLYLTVGRPSVLDDHYESDAAVETGRVVMNEVLRAADGAGR